MGRVRVPPAPPALILTDRADGKLWLIAFSVEGLPTVDGFGRITITDVLPNCRWRNCLVYKAGQEPYIGTNPYYRIFVRDGHLGLDIEELPHPVIDMDNQPISAVKGWDRNPRVIFEYTGPYSPRLAWSLWSDFNG